MSSIVQEAENLKDHVTEYIQHRVELVRLETLEKLADMCASLSTTVIFFFLILTVILFTLTSGALALGELWHSYALGFSAVGGGVVLCLIIGLLFRKTLVKRPLMNVFIRRMFKKWNTDA